MKNKISTSIYKYSAGTIDIPDLDRSFFFKPSVIVLILTNLLPVFGVFIFKWELYPIMLLFWLETLIISVLNLFKIFLCSPGDIKLWFQKIFIVPYFCFVYGFLIISCGLAISYLFGGNFYEVINTFSPRLISQYINQHHLIWAILALGASRCFSFGANYIGKGEYKQSTLKNLVYQPFGHIVVIEIVILATAAIIKIAGAPVMGLILLVLIKLGLDLISHIKYHSRSFKKEPEPVFEQN
jgi:hypothetical protein